VLPLLALLATVQAVSRARDDGSLELLLSHPIGRGAYLAGVTAVRLGVLALPLAAVVLALAAGAGSLHGDALPWAFVARSLAVCTTLIAAYVGIGIATSVRVRHAARAISIVFAIWAASVALLDFAAIGLLLRWRIPPQAVSAIAAANPVQAARMAILSSAEPTLATLGPVGFYLANRVGGDALFVLGTAWPLALGGFAWLFAWWSFRRGDAL
jgi:Cu-processing system permease protein